MERQPIKEIKVQNMHKCSSKNFQREPQPNSEQKADEMHVSPDIANANVSCSACSVNQFVI